MQIYSFNEIHYLDKGTNAFSINKTGNSELEIRRISDDKVYIQNIDFEVITMNKEHKVILFNDLLDKSDEYRIIAKELEVI